MDVTSWFLQDAKNKFGTVVDAALKGEPQTKRGKPAVVVLSVADSSGRADAAPPTFVTRDFRHFAPTGVAVEGPVHGRLIVIARPLIREFLS